MELQRLDARYGRLTFWRKILQVGAQMSRWRVSSLANCSDWVSRRVCKNLRMRHRSWAWRFPAGLKKQNSTKFVLISSRSPIQVEQMHTLVDVISCSELLTVSQPNSVQDLEDEAWRTSTNLEEKNSSRSTTRPAGHLHKWEHRCSSTPSQILCKSNECVMSLQAVLSAHPDCSFTQIKKANIFLIYCGKQC